MKSLKKALAILLSVLMVVFSFPLSALALPNPDNVDGTYAEDYDVEVHAYVTNYDAQYCYGYAASEVKFFDTSQPLKRSDLSSEDGAFAIVFTVENLDATEVIQLMFDVDWTKVQPASYGRRDAFTSGDLADPAIETSEDYQSEQDQYMGIDATGTANKSVTGKLQVSQTFVNGGASPAVEKTQQIDCGPEDTYDGFFMCALGYCLADGVDEINLQEVFNFHVNDYDSPIITKVGNDNKNIVPVGAVNVDGEPVKSTTYIFPEWGINAPDEPSEDVTYTYTFNDGHTEEVIAPEGTAPQAPENTAATEPVSNNDGTHTSTVYTWPAWESGVTEYTEIATPTQTACSMEETEAQVDPIHKDGQLVDGKTAVMTCTECGYQTGGEVIDAGEHVYELDEEASTAATCVAAGENVYVCTVCGASYTEPTEIDPNNHANVVTDPAVDATCTTPGLTEGSHCEACSTVITAQEEVPALGHDYQISDSTDATCVTPGSVTYTCTRCDDSYTEDGVLDPNNHEGDVALDPETVKEATRGEDGYTGDTVCSACGAVVEKGEVIPALGVQITVTQNELGSTTLNGEATTGTAQKVAYEKTYTLAATANEGAEFIGWQVNGKLVSTDATYTTTAYADTTYVPVFAEAADEFTVTFIDQFNKVIGTYTNAEIAEMEALPEAVSYLGYTFDGWSMTLEEVKALDTNAIVTASYTKDEAVTYTVTAPGCTIIDVANGTQANDALEVAFDSMVTIKPVDGEATAWTVNGANAAYGSEYTFYVTSDVEVAYSSDEVTAQPTVAAVAVEATTGGARFLATRSVPEGYTLIESGFVYGKDVAQADTALVLENVGNGCYLYKNSNTAADGQFALTVNTSTPGTLYARAYIMVADSDGVTSVYYADVQNYTVA